MNADWLCPVSCLLNEHPTATSWLCLFYNQPSWHEHFGINFSLTVCCVYCRLLPAWECCYTWIGIVIIIIIRHLHCSQVLVQDASLQTSLDVVKGCFFFLNLPSPRQRSCMEKIQYIQNFKFKGFFVTKFSFSFQTAAVISVWVFGSGYTGLQGCVLLQCCRPF